MEQKQSSIVLSFHESLLRASDINLLKNNDWLNDTIISFYFEYLEKVAFKNEPSLLFISPEVTQCIKIVSHNEVNLFLTPLKAKSRSFIFFAVNDNNTEAAGGSHWSLLVFSRPEQAFFHFDSSIGSNKTHAQSLAYTLAVPLNSVGSRIIEEVQTLQQDNGYDCGVHVLCNVDLIADFVAKYDRVRGCGTVQRRSVDTKRFDLLNIIAGLGGSI